ncbi:MAG: VOC family protein [Calditrichia bacterium]
MFTRTGFILYVRKYPECVAFYREKLELPIMFNTPEITCFKFNESYLMVEMDDQVPAPLRGETYTTCLRMNVPNVKAFADGLTAKGVTVDYQKHEWGSVAKFNDPDGNLCAFKDDEKFEQQVEKGLVI